MTITSKILASHLGLAQSTVSMALNDHPHINSKTRQRVQETARRLGYSPNRIARAMRTRRTKTLGIIFPSVKVSFFPAMLDGMEQAAKEKDYQCLLCQSQNSVETLEKEVRALREYCADGLIIFPINSFVHAEFYQNLIQQEVSFVIVGHEVEGVEAPFISNDDVLAGRLATEHLLGLGHRRIACVRGNPRSFSSHLRYRGYCKAMKQAGFPVENSLVVGDGFEIRNGQEAVESLLARKISFSALVASTDLAAFGAMEALRKHGLKVPDDVSVVGCGDLEMASVMSPKLTTVDQKPGEIGHQAIPLLFQRMKGEASLAEKIIIQPSLVVRESTQALPL